MKTNPPQKISIVVPVAPDDEKHKAHFQAQINDEHVEILFISEGTRSKSMNFGASRAKHDYLWFLHIDTILAPDSLKNLRKSIGDHPYALLYFDLKFHNDGPNLTWINALGIRYRSRVWECPSGQQGFCIRKKEFEQIGGFAEDLERREDELFVRMARRENILIRPVAATITTSARAYRDNWAKTTAGNVWGFIKRAVKG